MRDPLTISVALCTYNGERFLAEQLESLATQIRRPDELVIVDDASVDGTVALARSFARRAPFPVRVEVNDSTLGVPANFDKALRLVTSDLVALCDQDDVWLPHRLSDPARILEAAEGVSLVFSDADVVGEGLESTGRSLFSINGYRSVRRDLHAGRSLQALLKRSVACGATMTFRARLISELRPISRAGSHDVWISLLLAARGSVVALEKSTIRYRQHGANQIGAVVGGARGKLLHRRTAGTYGDERTQYAELLERLASARPAVPLARRAVAEKLRHLDVRYDLPSGAMRRTAAVLRELASGRYYSYSRGLQSAVFDLVFRSREEGVLPPADSVGGSR